MKNKYIEELEMTAEELLIDGKALAQFQLNQLKDEIFSKKLRPKFGVIMVGNHPESEVYVKRKRIVAKEIGVEAVLLHLPQEISQEELEHTIITLNKDTTFHGILLQLPLPPHLDPLRAINTIDPLKDIDGQTRENQGLLFCGQPRFVPCTPLGCFSMLRELCTLSGKTVTVVGRSYLVGRPLAALLNNHDATVTLAHLHTRNLVEACNRADIIVSAVGHPGLITHAHVKEGAIVIDVGITRVGGRLRGDVDFASVAPKCQAITPVPGGVGPMTIASLMANVVKASE